MSHKMRPKSGTTSTFHGVTFFAIERKYQAFVKLRGKRVHLGMWADERAAAEARDRGVLFFGLDWPLNLPESREAGPLSPLLLRVLARQHTKRSHSSQYFGVSWNTRRQLWNVTLCTGAGKALLVAKFADERSAAIAYDRLQRCRNEHVKLNFPKENFAAATVAEIREWSRGLREKRRLAANSDKEMTATVNRAAAQ